MNFQNNNLIFPWMLEYFRIQEMNDLAIITQKWCDSCSPANTFVYWDPSLRLCQCWHFITEHYNNSYVDNNTKEPLMKDHTDERPPLFTNPFLKKVPFRKAFCEEGCTAPWQKQKTQQQQKHNLMRDYPSSQNPFLKHSLVSEQNPFLGKQNPFLKQHTRELISTQNT